MRIGSIGVRLAAPAVPTFQFSSPLSLLDFDLVLFDPEEVLGEYWDQKRTTHKDRPLIYEQAQGRLREDTSRRVREFKELRALGRTVVLITPHPFSWYSTFHQSGRAPSMCPATQTISCL